VKGKVRRWNWEVPKQGDCKEKGGVVPPCKGVDHPHQKKMRAKNQNRGKSLAPRENKSTCRSILSSSWFYFSFYIL